MTDRDEAESRLYSAEQVRERLGVANVRAAFAWLSKHGISSTHGYPADEVDEELSKRRR